MRFPPGSCHKVKDGCDGQLGTLGTVKPLGVGIVADMLIGYSLQVVSAGTVPYNQHRTNWIDICSDTLPIKLRHVSLSVLRSE